MKLKTKRIEYNRKRNIYGKVIDSSYRWVIIKKRWPHKPLYLRLLIPNDPEQFVGKKVEWTGYRDHATNFRTEIAAQNEIINIKNNPDDYIL